MRNIEIQEQICVTQRFIEDTIKYYRGMPSTFGIGILCWSGGREEVIKEIKKLSEVGKAILLLRLRFTEWLKITALTGSEAKKQ